LRTRLSVRAGCQESRDEQCRYYSNHFESHTRPGKSVDTAPRTDAAINRHTIISLYLTPMASFRLAIYLA
jgi:hypothetical protein